MFKRHYILILVVTLTLLAVPFGIIWPNIKEIKKTSQAIYYEYEFLEEKNRLGLSIKKAMKIYNDLEHYAPDLTALALYPGQELNFIQATEELATKNNVTTKLNLDINKIKKGSQYHQLPFTLFVTGNFPNVMSYLGSIRTMPMATILTDMNMYTKNEKKSNTNYVESQISGFVIWRGEIPQPPTKPKK